MTRFKSDPMPQIDSGLIEVGDKVSFWDDRSNFQRQGIVEKITGKYYFIRSAGKRRKVLINAERFYRIENGKMFLVVETPN